MGDGVDERRERGDRSAARLAAAVADLPAYDGDHGIDGLQWKTKALVRIAGGRPFV